MKKILLDNALESWSIAIKYCNDIKSGLATLHYQKTFVSSLHNAIELFLKQIMLDKNDHSIANLAKVKNEDDANLQLRYFKSDNLNDFFLSLSDDDRNKFYSIEFSKLVDNSTNLIKDTLTKLNIPSLKEELKKLQAFRNNETHFYISKTDYLSEEAFIMLHNLMIDLFEVLQDYNLLPYWGEAWDEYKHLEFKPQKISNFSYSSALCSNPIAKSIINTLSGKQLYYYSDSSYDLAKQYFDEKLEINEQSNFSFNEIVSTIYMLKLNNYIKINPLELSDETILDNGELIPPQIAYLIDFTI